MLRSTITSIVVPVAIAGAPAFAQDSPTKPVRITVPFAADCPADVDARVIGVRLQDRGAVVRPRGASDTRERRTRVKPHDERPASTPH